MIGEPTGHYCWFKKCPNCKVTNYGCIATKYCGNCGTEINGQAYDERQYWGQSAQDWGAVKGIAILKGAGDYYYGEAGDGYYGYGNGV